MAKSDIRSLDDLRGKKVNFGPAGSGSSLTGTIVFQRLGVQVEQVLIDQQSALQKVQSGEVAALVRVVGKPVDFFTRIPPTSGLHLVPVPFTKAFADFYTLGEFERKDYPIAESPKARRSRLSRCQLFLPYSIGQRGAIGTAASNASRSGSSPSGINSLSRPVIPNGERSILAPQFPVGRAMALPRRCSSVFTVLPYRHKETSVATFRCFWIALVLEHHKPSQTARFCSVSFCNGESSRGDSDGEAMHC